MKKLVIYCILFLLPILLFIVFVPVNKRLAYQGLKNDCSDHGLWVYDRMHISQKPVDVAFFGSSHTFNGINDELIEDSLGINVCNLGYCRLGNNLIYSFIKELIKTKKVKTIVLEVRDDENLYSHPIFPYVADTKDVIFSKPFFNNKFFSDIIKHLSYKVQIFQETLFKRDSIAAIRKDGFGFGTSADTISANTLDSAKERRLRNSHHFSTFQRKLLMVYPHAYLKKISNLCKENQINLIFLYLPVYGSSTEKPLEYNTYLKYGTVLMPPKEIFRNQQNWSDDSHLNLAGANKISNWLVVELR
jgi:hypothetical protein